MGTIQTLFIKAKHWQIFALLFVVPQFACFVAMVSMRIAAMAVVTIAFMLLFQGWFWSIGSFLSSRLEMRGIANRNIFIFALIFPVLYIPAFFWFTLRSGDFPPLMVLTHLLAMACMFYLLYFVAKSLVMLESGKQASFPDYFGVFMLFWFFPIGVWFLQPKMNRLYLQSLARS